MKMKMKKVTLTISFGLLLLTNINAREFYIPDSIVQATRDNFVADSLRFMDLLNTLLASEDEETIEDVSSSLDRLNYLKFIRKHSDEIVEKLSGVERKRSPHYRLLSLTNPPDSLRDAIMEFGGAVSRARLGNSRAIAHFINEYTSRKNREDADVSFDGMSYFLEILLSLNSQVALDTIFSDMQSTRIITRCERIFATDKDCFWTSYTYLVSIIPILAEKHLDEPLFNRRFITRFVIFANSQDNLPPELPGFFRALEEFILREYGRQITINVPFVIAAGE
jgi:hypothetical protein